MVNGCILEDISTVGLVGSSHDPSPTAVGCLPSIDSIDNHSPASSPLVNDGCLANNGSYWFMADGQQSIKAYNAVCFGFLVVANGDQTRVDVGYMMGWTGQR